MRTVSDSAARQPEKARVTGSSRVLCSAVDLEAASGDRAIEIEIEIEMRCLAGWQRIPTLENRSVVPLSALLPAFLGDSAGLTT
jgi:hypothetical protein